MRLVWLEKAVNHFAVEFVRVAFNGARSIVICSLIDNLYLWWKIGRAEVPRPNIHADRCELEADDFEMVYGTVRSIALKIRDSQPDLDKIILVKAIFWCQAVSAWVR